MKIHLPPASCCLQGTEGEGEESELVGTCARLWRNHLLATLAAFLPG